MRRVELEGVPEVQGTVCPPPSKSGSHRVLIAASLCDGSTELRNVLDAEDVRATLRLCRMLGAEVDVDGEERLEATVSGFGDSPRAPEDVVDCGNSGTTLRLGCGLAGLVGEAVVLTGDDSLRSRPVGDLLAALRSLGVDARGRVGRSEEYPPVVISGRPFRERVAVYGDVSSQFVSALLFLGAGLGALRVDVVGDLRSRPYVDMTVETLERFGVSVVREDLSFEVEGRPRSPGELRVENDWSSAGYFVALGAIGGEVRIEGVELDSSHPDRRIVEIVREMGAEVRRVDGGIVVRSTGRLEGIEVDLSDSPDLVPTVAAMACFAEGVTRIENVGHLRYKEVDRLRVLAEELPKFGVEVREGEDWLEIVGGEPVGARVDSRGDHRMAMALAVVGAFARGSTVIERADAVSISYPGFWEDLASIGVPVRSV
ncbi:3-phosphoshikimate 1-carboxyvinyltransferase [Methanopyrus kandleri]